MGGTALLSVVKQTAWSQCKGSAAKAEIPFADGAIRKNDGWPLGDDARAQPLATVA